VTGKPAPSEVFLNVPYDRRFEKIFLAYLSGISAFGLVPRATLEIPTSARRLEKILSLIATCRYSIHDLSRVELDHTAPRTPRFNMPFEIGLAVAHRRNKRGEKHEWFVCETKRFRLSKSLSDLDGTDPHIHEGKVLGVFRELGSIFIKSKRQPTAQQMAQIYSELRKSVPAILRQSASKSFYTAKVFKDLSVAAKISAERIVT
jgi:hypothetical protein